MFLNVNKYKKIVAAKKELLHEQCEGVLTQYERTQFIVRYHTRHIMLFSEIKKAVCISKCVCICIPPGVCFVSTFYNRQYEMLYTNYIWLNVIVFVFMLFIYAVVSTEFDQIVSIYEKEV